MAVELILVGSISSHYRKISALRPLLDKHGYKFIENKTVSHQWDGNYHVCYHYEVDATITCSPEKDLPVLRFLAEVAQIPGVFITDCPEHAKHYYWEEQRAELPSLDNASKVPQ